MMRRRRVAIGHPVVASGMVNVLWVDPWFDVARTPNKRDVGTALNR